MRVQALPPGCGSSGAPVVSHTIVPSTQTIAFTSTGAQTFTLSEAGYDGTFTAISSNTNVATVAATSTTQAASQVKSSTAASSNMRDAAAAASGTAQTTFQVTPVGGGSATITVTDTIGDSISIPVSVTGAILSPQLRN